MEHPAGRFSRRRVLQSGATIFVTSIVSACGGETPSPTAAPAPGSPGTTQPQPTRTIPTETPRAPSTPAPARSAVPSIRVTPIAEFFTVAIGVLGPVALPNWNLSVEGNIDRPFVLTMDELRSLPAVTEMRTIECISNPPGGTYIGNAEWKGFRFRELVDRAQVRAGATEVRIDAFDEFYSSVPLELARDEHSLLVYEMNGEPLTPEHGAPLRVLWPGRYGMKQPKWIKKVTFATSPSGLWEENGWSRDARILPTSRIDSPADGAKTTDKTITLQGIAFSGSEGIARVEVSLDDGKTWNAADLVQAPPPIRPYVWTQWLWKGPAPLGAAAILARATDGAGHSQTREPVNSFPDGTDQMQVIQVEFQ